MLPGQNLREQMTRDWLFQEERGRQALERVNHRMD